MKRRKPQRHKEEKEQKKLFVPFVSLWLIFLFMNRSFAQIARHTIDGTILVFLSEALLLPTGLVTAAYLTRRLGSAEYGLLALTVTLVTWLEWTIASLFSRATIKLVGETADWKSV